MDQDASLYAQNATNSHNQEYGIGKEAKNYKPAEETKEMASDNKTLVSIGLGSR